MKLLSWNMTASSTSSHIPLKSATMFVEWFLLYSSVILVVQILTNSNNQVLSDCPTGFGEPPPACGPSPATDVHPDISAHWWPWSKGYSKNSNIFGCIKFWMMCCLISNTLAGKALVHAFFGGARIYLGPKTTSGTLRQYWQYHEKVLFR